MSNGNWLLGGGPSLVGMYNALAPSLRACFSTSKHGGQVTGSVQGLVRSRPWGWTLFSLGPEWCRAAPESPFERTSSPLCRDRPSAICRGIPYWCTGDPDRQSQSCVMRPCREREREREREASARTRLESLEPVPGPLDLRRMFVAPVSLGPTGGSHGCGSRSDSSEGGRGHCHDLRTTSQSLLDLRRGYEYTLHLTSNSDAGYAVLPLTLLGAPVTSARIV